MEEKELEKNLITLMDTNGDGRVSDEESQNVFGIQEKRT